MRLLIADDDGNVHEVMEDIEECDLSKPLAAAHVMQQITITLARILK